MKVNTKVSILLLASLTLGLSSCGKTDGESQADSSSPVSESQIGDKSQEHIIYRDAETNEVITDADFQFSQKYTYLTGSPMTWSTGVIKWWYNPAGQPSQYTTNQVVDGLIASTRRWENVCGITFQYQGLTTKAVRLSGCDGASAVGWGPLSGSVVGQAQACYSRSSFSELDLMLDNLAPMQITSLDFMNKVAVHEFGHVLGLGHTDITPAVMTAMLTTGIPVQDDIVGCQSLYGVPSTTPPPTPSTTTTTTTTSTTLTTTTTTLTPNLFCQPGATRSCNVTNGTGNQTCKATGSSWGSCQIKQCKDGYTIRNGRCRRI
ncbi:MAG: matrixin family metalloprotease [Pseudobdellovibrionaceae bacterium]